MKQYAKNKRFHTIHFSAFFDKLHTAKCANRYKYKPRPENATQIRYIGIGVRGTFCKSSQPNPDFTHFHRPDVENYAQGHGGQPGEEGYWLMWVAVDEFDSQGRHITPGVDEKFSPTPAPDC